MMSTCERKLLSVKAEVKHLRRAFEALQRETERLRRQNAALLEALEAMLHKTHRVSYPYLICFHCESAIQYGDEPENAHHYRDCPITKARAAIAEARREEAQDEQE